MKENELLEKLKATTAADAAFRDVMHAFAARERARNQVTVEALSRRMLREKFVYPVEDYARVLKTLADLGFGQLEVKRRGKASKVVALRNVKVTLQSIGQAAVGSGELVAFQQRRRYGKIDRRQTKATPTAAPTVAAPSRRHTDIIETVSGITITVTIGSKPVTVSVPQGMSPQEVGSLVARLQGKGTA